MARQYSNNSGVSGGVLTVEEVHPNCVDVFYSPEREKFIHSGLDPEKEGKNPVQLLHINGQNRFITIYPLITLVGHFKFLRPKYKTVKGITLAGFDFTTPENDEGVLDLLEKLPKGFVKDYDYGLGLLKEYRFIIDVIEELTDCTEIVISKSHQTGLDEFSPDLFFISYKDFETARKSLNRISQRAQNAAQSVKRVQIFNMFATRVGATEKPIETGNHPVTRLLMQASQSDDHLGDTAQDAVLNALSENTKMIAERRPEKLAKLQNDIELVTLELLIQRYTEMLTQKLDERHWQDFFNENPFILSFAFGYPVVKVNDQASIGGRKLSGSGEKITDFLVKNSMTNNTALFEIKTPQTEILQKTPYRDGVFTPSSQLSGSINQALDQKYQFQKEIASRKETSRVYDIESYAVHCCLIIGCTPTDVDKQKSFELCRHNSKDVEIITFDELLAKMKQLYDFLNADD